MSFFGLKIYAFLSSSDPFIKQLFCVTSLQYRIIELRLVYINIVPLRNNILGLLQYTDTGE